MSTKRPAGVDPVRTDRPTTFFVLPLVLNMKGGPAVAVFAERHRSRAEAIAKAAPRPPEGGWKVLPKSGLELLAWLKEQQAEGVRQVLASPEPNPDGSTVGGYVLEDLAQLLNSGRALAVLNDAP
jgi:hypothetical protein